MLLHCTLGRYARLYSWVQAEAHFVFSLFATGMGGNSFDFGNKKDINLYLSSCLVDPGSCNNLEELLAK